MNDLTQAAETPTAAPVDFTPTLPEGTGAINPRDAGRLLSDAREKALKASTEQTEKKTEQPRVNGRFASAAAPESALEGADAGPDDPVPGETVQDDPAELPSIDPPRSWSKEDKELFASLPRETQERLSDRERSRESDFLKRQNEAAEKSKALEAKEKAAETARQNYETAAQRTLEVLNREMAKDFGDIRSQADVDRLATEDPFRFAQFQARLMGLQQMQQEVADNKRQQAERKKQEFEKWAKEQDAKFEKQFPEFADKEKAEGISKKLARYLIDEVGVPEEALPGLRNEELFRDAMYQRVLYDAYRWHTASVTARKAAAVEKPAPQRPGTGQQRGAQHQDAVAAAQARLKGARGVEAAKAAADLMAARRLAVRR